MLLQCSCACIEMLSPVLIRLHSFNNNGLLVARLGGDVEIHPMFRDETVDSKSWL